MDMQQIENMGYQELSNRSNRALIKSAILESLTALWEKDSWYLDTETTGLGENDEVIEISIIDKNKNTILNTLIKPTKPVPEEAIKIHGITNEMLEDAPSFEEVSILFEKITAKYKETTPTVVVYNKEFDVRLLKQTVTAHLGDNPLVHGFNSLGGWIYSLELTDSFFCLKSAYEIYHGVPNNQRDGFEWQSLVRAAERFDVLENNAHRALNDCLMTRNFLEAFVQNKGIQTNYTMINAKKLHASIHSYNEGREHLKKIGKEDLIVDFSIKECVLALQDLLNTALYKGGSSSEYIRNFLLSLYSTDFIFQLRDLKGLDRKNYNNCMLVLKLNQFHFHTENHNYFENDYGFIELAAQYQEQHADGK